jgi:hypothetical protein
MPEIQWQRMNPKGIMRPQSGYGIIENKNF